MIALLPEIPPLAVLLAAAWLARRAGLPGGALVVGAAACLALAALRAQVARGLRRDGFTGREPRARAAERLLLGASWITAGGFALSGLAPLLPDRRLPALLALAGLALLLRGALADGSRRATPPPRGEERHWRLGFLYANRADRAVLVPARLGPGYTLNLGRPLGWLALAALLGLPAAAAAWLAARL